MGLIFVILGFVALPAAALVRPIRALIPKLIVVRSRLLTGCGSRASE
jgi:hypothetical protein